MRSRTAAMFSVGALPFSLKKSTRLPLRRAVAWKSLKAALKTRFCRSRLLPLRFSGW